MILIFVNNGRVFKLESNEKGIRVFLAESWDAYEKFQNGETDTLTWQIMARV